MSFFTFNRNAEAVKDSSGSTNYVVKSGMYDVVIKNIIVDKSPNGSDYLNLNITYNNQDQTIYNAIRLTNNDGSANFEANNFSKLLVLADVPDGEEINDPVPMQLPIGKGGEMKECMVLDQLRDIPVIMRVVMEYSMYNGKIMEKKLIKNFFSVVDHATAAEIVNNEEHGKQYEKELEEADKAVYKDGLTEEDIKAWKKDRNSAPKEEPKKPSMGVKRSFGRR